MKSLLTSLCCALFSLQLLAQSYVTDTFTLTDNSRQRSIPVKLYRPATLTGLHPVIIFSHGLGGSREAGGYLGEALATHGYVCFFIQHYGSDETVWKGKSLTQAGAALKNSLKEPANFTNRAADIPFVVQALQQLQQQDALLKGHLDLNNIGMAGHSYGARSTMIAAGELLGGRIDQYTVPQIKAGLVLSPNTPEKVNGNLKDYYANIRIPLFHMTGTKDDYPLDRTGNFDPAQRQLPYQHISSSPQYLLVLNGATHATFGGGSRPRFGAANTRHLSAITTGAIAFFDAYLKNDKQQLQWLQQQYSNSLQKGDVFTCKATTAAQ
jgi:predicted dienelactone hydrolase